MLARGLGTRMRTPDPRASLTPDQRRAADAGIKAMIPVHGRPFMDYVLSGLADAGVTSIALVVAPAHEAMRRYYLTEAPPSRVAVRFVVQEEPLGTANAVLAAERWAGDDGFLAMNADNLYPTPAVADLARLDEPGLLGFERDELVRSGNIPHDRIAAFALIEHDARGYLTHIVEKPSVDLPPEGGSHERVESESHQRGESGTSTSTVPVASAFRRKNAPLISMNCWRFDSRIFPACRDVPRSVRGEFELPEAVALAVRRGVPFKVLRARGPVLDLSRRSDAAAVADRLAGFVPRP